MYVREYVCICICMKEIMCVFLQTADVLVVSSAIWLHVDFLGLVNTGLNSNTPGAKR